MSKIFLFLTILWSLCGTAQTITMEFPAFAGKTYDFIIFQGSKEEAIINDIIPANGKFELTIPAQYAPYTGMSRWLITNSETGGGLDMAIPGFDFSVSCLSDQPDNTNIIYTGFDAVNELNRLYNEQQKIIGRYEIMSKATQLYDKTDSLHAFFQNEKERQGKAYAQFQEDLKKNPNFNARILPIINLMNGYSNRLTEDEREKALFFNEYFTQKISFEDLYASGHWEGIIQSWVMLQLNVINDKAQFANDFKSISNKIQNPKHYTDFVDRTTFFLTQLGKDDYIDAISKTVLDSGKVTAYMGSLQVYLKSLVGMKASDLIISGPSEVKQKNQKKVLKTNQLAKGKDTKTLLIFYQSGCGPCETLMAALMQYYETLKNKGIRLISISADQDEQVFKFNSAPYPWKDKYCDYEGIDGINFKNYAVIGTPTMYLIGKEGKIEKRLGTIEELMLFIN